MDLVLERALKLACLIRDSHEGGAWRESQEDLYKHLVMPDLSKAPFKRSSIVERFGFILSTNGVSVRSLFLPLLVKKYIPERSFVDIRNELQRHREIWLHYQPLESRFVFVFTAIAYLRSIAPGFPHNDLIYTAPDAIWSHLSSHKEVPWDSEFTFANDADSTLDTHLARVIPGSAQVIAIELRSLAATIRNSETWLELSRAYKMIDKHPNLRTELLRARQQYFRELAVYSSPSVSESTWYVASDILVNQAYEKRGERIQRYVKSFLEYERLIERIYWLLSQLIMFEHISTVSSSNPQQVQQVCIGGGREAFLTALALTQGKTMGTGLLIHMTMPELEGVADGIYQVNWLRRKYSPENGFHLYFRAQCLWHCTLEALLADTKEYKQPVLIPTEDLDMVSNTRMAILKGNNLIDTLEVGQFLSYDITETMYLP